MKRPYNEVWEVKRDFPTYFTRVNTRGFKSRYGREVFGGKYFITSEQFEYTARRYTIREITRTGIVTHEGTDGFMKYNSWAQAKYAIDRLLEGE